MFHLMFQLMRGLFVLSVLFLGGLAAGCGGTDSTGTPTGPSGGGTTPDIAGRYTYEADATTMFCSGAPNVPLPAVSDGLTITQSGNQFDGVLDIQSALGAPTGASFFENCMINTDSTYACTGTFADPNSTITFTSRGVFTPTGFTGSTDLRMTLTGGAVCTWTKQERGTKVS